MSLFRDMAASASSAHTHYFAQSVLLTEPTVAPRSVDAVLYKSRTETRTDEHGRQNRVTLRDCRFPSLETVRHDATLTADGITYVIDQVRGMEASGLYVTLMQIEQYSTGRTNYRGKPG
jgi:hypothetical protein